MRDDVDAEGLAQELASHRASGHSCGRLPCAGPFQHIAGIVEPVLEHARVVGVTGTRTSQRGIAGQFREFTLVDRVSGHDLGPLRPFGVGDFDRDRAAHGAPVPDPAHDGDLVGLELHPRTASIPQPATRQLRGNIGRRHLDTGHHPLEDGDEGGTMRLSGSYPAQHDLHLSTSRRFPGHRCPCA